MTPKHIRVTEVDGHAVVCFNNLERVVVPGEELEQLDSELQALAGRESWASVILDFEDEPFIPYCAFEAVLVRLHKMFGKRLKLCNVPSLVMEHFQTNRLATVFHIWATRDDALQASHTGRQAKEQDRDH